MNGPSLSRVRIAYAIWLFGVFAYFVPAATWNPVSRFNLTRAIVEHRTLSIDAYADSTGDRALRNGHWYSDKAPVPALLAVVPYAIVHAVQTRHGRVPEFHATGTPDMPARRVTVNVAFAQGLYVCSAFTAAAAGALLGVLVFEALRRRAGPRIALGASIFVLLGSPLFPYATSFYGHVVAAAFLFAAVFLLVSPDRESDYVPSAVRVRLAGAAVVLAVGSEYIVAGPAAAACAVVLVRGGRARAWPLVRDLAIGAALPAAIVGAYHAACFGAPWKTGYSFIAREEFARGHALGLLGIRLPSLHALWGMYFSLERGLFVIAPVLLVGAIGGAIVLARRRATASDFVGLAVVIALSLLNAGYYMWWGGASVGPRHLVPAIPFLGLGVAAALTRRGARGVTIVLGALSIAFMLALSSIGLEAPEAGSILVDYAWARLARGQIAHLSGASNLGVELGMPPAASLGPLFAWLLVGARLVFRELEPSRDAATDRA